MDHCTREIRHGRLDRSLAKKINQFYSNKKVNIKPFFDWLGVTKSGVEWFIEHKLRNSKHLIETNETNSKNETVELSSQIEKMLAKSFESNEDFILYDKGIDI